MLWMILMDAGCDSKIEMKMNAVSEGDNETFADTKK